MPESVALPLHCPTCGRAIVVRYVREPELPAPVPTHTVCPYMDCDGRIELGALGGTVAFVGTDVLRKG